MNNNSNCKTIVFRMDIVSSCQLFRTHVCISVERVILHYSPVSVHLIYVYCLFSTSFSSNSPINSCRNFIRSLFFSYVYAYFLGPGRVPLGCFCCISNEKQNTQLPLCSSQQKTHIIYMTFP